MAAAPFPDDVDLDTLTHAQLNAMAEQYEVTVLLQVSLVTTVTVPAGSATAARALVKEQFNAIGASLAYVADGPYAWDVIASRMAIDAVEPAEDTTAP